MTSGDRRSPGPRSDDDRFPSPQPGRGRSALRRDDLPRQAVAPRGRGDGDHPAGGGDHGLAPGPTGSRPGRSAPRGRSGGPPHVPRGLAPLPGAGPELRRAGEALRAYRHRSEMVLVSHGEPVQGGRAAISGRSAEAGEEAFDCSPPSLRLVEVDVVTARDVTSAAAGSAVPSPPPPPRRSPRSPRTISVGANSPPCPNAHGRGGDRLDHDVDAKAGTSSSSVSFRLRAHARAAGVSPPKYSCAASRDGNIGHAESSFRISSGCPGFASTGEASAITSPRTRSGRAAATRNAVCPPSDWPIRTAGASASSSMPRRHPR